jgi:hypothetical protein
VYKKVALKEKKIRTKINGKFNDIISAVENKYKNITIELLLIDIRLVLERNNAGLKELSCFA